MTHQDDSPLGPEVRALAQSLLDSAASDAPSPELHRTVAGALGLGSLAAASIAQGANLAQSVANAAGAGAEASSLGTAATALGGGLKIAPLLALGKWVAGGFVVASVAVGTLKVAERTDAPVRGGRTDRMASSAHNARGAARAENLGPAQPPAGSAAAIGPAFSRESVPHASVTAMPTTQDPVQAPGPEVTRAFGAAADEPPAVPRTEPGTSTPAVGLGSFPPAQQTRSEPSKLGDQLAGEVRLLDSARANVASGRLGPALAALDQYHSGYPNGVLRAEALALTVDAWLRAGNEARARAWVQALERAFPTSQHLERFSRLRNGTTPGGLTRP